MNVTRTIAKLILYYLAYQMGFSAVMLVISKFVPMDMVTITSLAMVASTLMMTWHLLRHGYVRLAEDGYKAVSPLVMGVSIVFIYSAMYIANLLVEQSGLPNTMEETFLAMSRNPIGILSITLLAPILEELLFRGAIQGALQRQIKPWGAIMISSLLFGLVHMNLAQIPFAFFLGIIFGWLYYRTGSLLPGVVGHILNNTVATITMNLYGNATIEECMPSDTAMWLWALVALVAFVVAGMWLNRELKCPQDEKNAV